MHEQVFSGIAAPNVNAAGLVLLMQAAGFGGAFFSVSSQGNSLVLITTESGETVSIAVDTLQSTLITTGLISWSQPTGLGVVIGSNVAQGLLGLNEDEAHVGGRSLELVAAINSLEPAGLAQASLDDNGFLVLSSLDTTTTSSLTIKSTSGLNMAVAAATGILQYGEVFGRSSREAAAAVIPLARFGVVLGDGIRVLGANRQYTGTVTAVGDTQVTMTSNIPADVGNIPVAIMDGSADSFLDMLEALRQVLLLIGRSHLRNRLAIETFVERMELLSGRPSLDRGHAKKLLTSLIETLSLLTDHPPQASDLDTRLVELNLTRPVASANMESALGVYASLVDSDTVAAVDATVSSFEERGYDRAGKLLVWGDVTGFLNLTPATSSRSGNLEQAMRVAAKKTVPRRTEAQVVQSVPSVSVAIASPSSTRAEK